MTPHRLVALLMALAPAPATAAFTIAPDGANALLSTSVRDFRVGPLFDVDSGGSADLTNFEQTIASQVGAPGAGLRATATLRTTVDASSIRASGSYEIVHDFEIAPDRENMESAASATFSVTFCVDEPMSFQVTGSGVAEGERASFRVDRFDDLHYATGLSSATFSGSPGFLFAAGVGVSGEDGTSEAPAADSGSRTGEIGQGCHVFSGGARGGLLSPIRDNVAGVALNPPETRGSFSVLLQLGPADPDDDSNVVRWVGGSSGLFAEEENWDPQRVPGGGDTALFDQGVATVDLVTAPAQLSRDALGPRGVPVPRLMDRLLVLIDPLRFTQESEVILSEPALDAPSLEVDGGTLEVDQTVVRAVNAVVSSDRPGAIEARGPAGALQTTATFAVGRGAHGAFSLIDGGEASTVRTLLGDGDEGVAAVTGASSSWSTGDLFVGHSSAGTLIVRGGGQVLSEDAFVDFAVPPGTVLPVQADIQGAASGGAPSLWDVQDLEVGPLGHILVGDGGLVRTAVAAVLGNSDTGRGKIELTGGRLEVGLDLVIGSNGLGEVTASKGQANVESLLKVGASDGIRGDGRLSLVNPSGQAEPLAVSDLVEVGTDPVSSGLIVVGSGATLLTSTTAEVGSAPEGSGRVEVNGGVWQIGSQLGVGADTSADGLDRGFVGLDSGGVVQVGTPSTPGNILIRERGIVFGSCLLYTSPSPRD